VVDLLKRTMPKMIDVEIKSGENIGSIIADPGQVEQVLMNLAINARDAMPEGGRLVFETSTVSVTDSVTGSLFEVPPGCYVQVSITDTGFGMEEEILNQIFEPFYTTKADGKGTGLGLSMVFGIMQNHGGAVSCYSEPGTGTTFRLYFPVTDEELSRVEVIQESDRMPEGTETVLLVDDEEIILDLVSSMLTEFGYKVLTAPNGDSALDLYRHHQEIIDLVILDLNMPGMDGIDCLEELRNLNVLSKIIVASGYSSGKQVDKVMEKGADDFISKPFEIGQLLNTVRKTLDQKQPALQGE
jgi:CheY-like chemotaxis protein